MKTTYKSKTLLQHAFATMLKDKMAMTSLIVVVIFALLAIASGTGLIPYDWSKEVGPSYSAPSLEHLFGTDIFGRSVVAKVLKGTEIAMLVGLLTSIIATLIGVTLGAVAGYFGGKIDELVVWFYTTFSSIP